MTFRGITYGPSASRSRTFPAHSALSFSSFARSFSSGFSCSISGTSTFHTSPGSCTDKIEEQPKQEALFEIGGPDEDGCVWICPPADKGDWCQNLGPRDKVVEILSQWLSSLDDGKGL